MVLRRRHSLREGVILGLVVATSIWLWIAIVDAIAGEPFRTFAVLGGIGASRYFTTCSASRTVWLPSRWCTARRSSRA